MRRALACISVSWLSCAGWLGCNLILGNESAVFAPEGSDAAAPDGDTPDAPLADGGTGDVAVRDAPDTEASTCVDTKSDPSHCGRCFHDCRGGSCIDGTCQPVTLVTESGRPGPIAVDGTHVYWANRQSGDIARVPIAGGARQLIYDGPSDTTPGQEIAVHQGHVYFALPETDGGIVRLSLIHI